MKTIIGRLSPLFACMPGFLCPGTKRICPAEFADQLQKRFLDGTKDSASVEALMAEIREHTDRLHGMYQKPNIKPALNQQLDDMGTRLWNLCNRLRRDSADESMDVKRLFVVGRAFAFHLLAVAHRSEKYQLSAAIRLIKLALKAGGSCIGESPERCNSCLFGISAQSRPR